MHCSSRSSWSVEGGREEEGVIREQHLDCQLKADGRDIKSHWTVCTDCVPLISIVQWVSASRVVDLFDTATDVYFIMTSLFVTLKIRRVLIAFDPVRVMCSTVALRMTS